MNQTQLLNLLSKEEKQRIRDQHNNACDICGKSSDKNGKPLRLAIEHDHELCKRKITAYKSFGIWVAHLEKIPERLIERFEAPTKAEAIKKAQKQMVLLAVRGICCFQCNRGLFWFRDNPELLEAAARYLHRFKENIGEEP